MQENRKESIDNAEKKPHNVRKGNVRNGVLAPEKGKLGRWKPGRRDGGGAREEYKERLGELRPIDDVFMRCMFKGKGLALVERVLRIVTGMGDIKVTSADTQRDLKGLVGARSIILDVYAVDSKGRLYNVEIQRQPGGASPRRGRYHASAMDVDCLHPGQGFGDLPETYIIFITEGDVYGEGKPVYEVERMNQTTGRSYGDGGHILYVNGSYRGDDPVGWLMHDFNCSDAGEMHYGWMAERTRYLKESEEGVLEMGSVLDDMKEEYINYGLEQGKREGREEGMREGIREGRQEGRRDGIREGRQEGMREGKRAHASKVARRMLSDGKYSASEVARISGLSKREVMSLAKKQERHR